MTRHQKYLQQLRQVRTHRRRARRNPDLSRADMIQVAESLGYTDLAGLLRSGGPIADQLVQEIQNALAEDDVLSDREAWTELAALAPRVLSLPPAALQALVAEFTRRAALAA